MTNSNINAQELLEQLLSSGPRTSSARARLTQKTYRLKGQRSLAAKGEDYLVDKLGIEDNEVAREYTP